MDLTYQGNVDTNGNTKIVNTTELILVVNSIIVNNLNSAYNFILYRGTPTGIVPLYRLTLDAGDSIRDSENYILNIGEYLQLVSNVSGTTFYASSKQL